MPFDWEDRARAILEQVGPAVVGVGRGEGSGTGLVVGPGWIVAHAHHLLGAGESVSASLLGRRTDVIFMGGRKTIGAVAADDGDFAILQADTADVRSPQWRPAEAPIAPGAPVCAVGRAPPALCRLTFGRVSSVGCEFKRPLGRVVQGAIEHTAPLGRNAWGSPIIVDADGRLMGLNAHRRDDGAFNIAVPADADLRERIDAMLKAAGA